VVVHKKLEGKGDDGDKPVPFEYVRRRADGGIYTAEEAKKLGLVDEIGYLDDAIQDAKKAAGLGDSSKAVTYERPFSLQQILGGGSSSDSGAAAADLKRLASSLTPRLWYLAPGAEGAGLLSAAH
jgi:protease-4